MAAQEHWLGRWAMDSMLINVSTRPFGRAIRLPEDEVQPSAGLGFSKSAASRRLQRSGHARRGSRRQLHQIERASQSEGVGPRLLPENCRAPLSVCAPSTLPQPQCWRARVHLSEALLA